MSDDVSGMSRAEAVAALETRSRVRFVVEVRHRGRSYGARGAVLCTERGEVESAGCELLAVMLGRALEQFAAADAREPGP